MTERTLSRCAELEQCSLWRILDVTRSLGAPISLKEILSLVIEAALDVLNAERGTVFLYDSGSDELYSRVATGTQEIRFSAKTGIAGETAQNLNLINVPDCYKDSRFNQEVDRKTGFKTRCLLSIPLIGVADELVGVLQVLNKKPGVFDTDDEIIARTLAAQCAVAVQRAKLIEEHLVKQKLERDLAVARDIQLGILPKVLPEMDDYDISAWSEPADETGGDIYDVFGLENDRIALLLGDATGHGIGPALSVSQLRSMFRMALRLNGGLEAAFKNINDQLKEDLPGNRFITAFLGILDTTEHKLYYHSGGQSPLLHFHADRRECEWLEASALPMGIMAGLPIEEPAPMEMEPGDIVGLISDGIFEFKNPEDEEFGKERVAELVSKNRSKSMQDLIEIMRTVVSDFARGTLQDDDMTMVLVKRSN